MPVVEIGKNKKGEFAIIKIITRNPTYSEFTRSGLEEYESIGTAHVDDEKGVKPGPVSKEYVRNLAEEIEEKCKKIKENLT